MIEIHGDEVYVNGRRALTTEQIAELSTRWATSGAVRAWIDRNDVEPCWEPAGKYYYPKDVGLEER